MCYMLVNSLIKCITIIMLKINIISDSECFIEFLKNLIKLSLEKQ